MDIDKKKFLIQIVIAVCISIFFQLMIDPWIYDPFIRNNMGVLEAGNAIVITSLSMWFFSFSIAHFFYRDNEVINNYLLCSFPPLVVIIVVEFSSLVFIDFLHIPPVIIVLISIIWKKANTLKLKNVAIASVILAGWATLVRLLGTNYTSVGLFPLGLIIIIAWPLLNILLVFIINLIEKKK
ncbi:MAG: hypothetical protein ACTSX4_09645 [Candidatus Helarchaeota archaeon]